MPRSSPKMGRAKISTTVASGNYKYLEKKVASGEARSIANAIDQSIAAARRLENRKRLAQATARYFNSLPADACTEEEAIASSLASAVQDINFNFDQEL